MKIKLIAPAKKPEWGEAFWDMRKVCKLAGAKANSAPLSLLTIAAVTPERFEVVVVDENVRPIDFDDPVDLVGITSFTSHAPRAYEIADEFRGRGVRVVMGGIHVSVLPEEALHHCDTVVVGEAERTWPQLLDDLSNGSMKRLYVQDEFPDITGSPVPRWDLVNQKDYLTLTVQTSRGCPNNCNFCSVTSFNGRKMRHKAIDSVVEELEGLRALSPWKTIFFTDDNLLGEKAYALRLFERLKNLDVTWMCQASINRLDDDDLLREMYAAGCRQVFIGFESVSRNSLTYLNKNKINRPLHYRAVVNKIHSRGIEVYGSFMLGSDGDTAEIYDDTIGFIDECNLTTAMANILTPAPGTELYRKLESDNRITCREWHKYDGEHICFIPSFTSPDRLVEDRKRLLKELYTHSRISKRLRGFGDSSAEARRGTGRAFKERIAASFSIMLVNPRHWSFIVGNIWSGTKPTVGSVLMAVSFSEYARKLKT